jgi:hypothetical protein
MVYNITLYKYLRILAVQFLLTSLYFTGGCKKYFLIMLNLKMKQIN